MQSISLDSYLVGRISIVSHYQRPTDSTRPVYTPSPPVSLPRLNSADLSESHLLPFARVSRDHDVAMTEIPKMSGSESRVWESGRNIERENVASH